MALTYNTVLRQIAVSVNAITGATPALLEASYATVPLTAANFQSSILSFTSLKDKMLNGEAKLVTAVAYQGDHPYRRPLTSQTANIASGGLIPATDSGGTNKIIGVYGAVRDAATGNILTKGKMSQISARVLNPGSMFLVSTGLWARQGERLYHTVTNAVLDVVTYTRPVADSLVLTTNVMLPDDAAPAYVQAALEECIRDDEFMSQASRFGEQFDKWVQRVLSSNSIDTITQVTEKAA